MTSIYEAAGGIDKFRELASAWHQRVLADEIASHPFDHGGIKGDHTERLACYIAEACGGPPLYTGKYGDETSVVRIHSGNGEHNDIDRQAVICFGLALQDVGFATGTDLHTALFNYFEWSVYRSTFNYPNSPDDVPANLPLPKWHWNGPV